MKYIFIIIGFLIIYQGKSQVSGGQLNKLEKLFNDGKYETCLFKADNLTYKEDYSRDPEPLLYISMCFYQISQSDDKEFRADYPDALKQSIKYATKFVRKDKKDVLYSNNIDFINTIKDEQKKNIKLSIDKKKYSKAASSAKVYNKLNRENDITVQYFIGVNEVLSKNISSGRKNISESFDKIKVQLDGGEVDVDSRMQPFVIDGFLKYSEYLVSEGKLFEARENLEVGKAIFPNDGYIKMQYKMVDKACADKEKADAETEAEAERLKKEKEEQENK